MSSDYSWEFKNGIIIHRYKGYTKQALPLKTVTYMSIHEKDVEFGLVSGQKISLGKDWACTYSDVITAVWDTFIKMHSTPDTVKDLLTLETS